MANLYNSVLEKINQTLADLGSAYKWIRVPEFLEGYAPLKGKVVVMIDDVKEVLEIFVPNLMVATDGKAFFIEYRGQLLDELVSQIMSHNPSVILVDFHLSKNVKGSDVIARLIGQNFTGELVGFSSDAAVVSQFMDAGAKGVVEKDFPEKSVKAAATLVRATK